MIARIPQALLVLSSLLLVAGGAVHAEAYGRAIRAADASNLASFFAEGLKMLWLGDSAMMFVLAAICGAIAARPRLASRALVLLLALFPASLAVLLYLFLGNFAAGHLLAAVATGIALAALFLPPSLDPTSAKGA